MFLLPFFFLVNELGIIIFFPKEQIFVKHKRAKLELSKRKRGEEEHRLLFHILVSNSKLQHQHDGRLAQENEARAGSTCS